MENEKTVMDLLDELKNQTDWQTDEKTREALVNKLILSMIED
ncbi:MULTISPECIES: hypothetical protein [unclassified Dehalobacter]|nr:MULTISPECIES: hypothetical protein [unclassified Dehalobacter]